MMPKKSSSLQNLVIEIEKSRKQISDSAETMLSITENIQNSFLKFAKTPLPDLSPLSRLNVVGESLTNLVRSLQETTQFVVPMTQQISNLIGETLNKINTQWIEQFAELGKRIEKILSELDVQSEEIAPKLQKANLWISPNMSFELIRETIALCKNPEATSHDVQALYINHYSQNDYELLQGTVDNWKSNPFFSERIEVINAALDSHIAHKFILSIPALLPVIEGIATDISGKSAGHPTKRIKEVIGVHYSTFLPAASKQVFLNLLEEIGFFGYINFEKYTSDNYSIFLADKGIIEEECLNRHAILHGVQKKYASEINSLKAFLILDMLSYLEDKE